MQYQKMKSQSRRNANFGASFIPVQFFRKLE
ncbi:MAG: hypothetical protein H6Q68_1604 [Firmicutes bacterium]|nr:hypothetical protein [Bacillota bacterium]